MSTITGEIETLRSRGCGEWVDAQRDPAEAVRVRAEPDTAILQEK